MDYIERGKLLLSPKAKFGIKFVIIRWTIPVSFYRQRRISSLDIYFTLDLLQGDEVTKRERIGK